MTPEGKVKKRVKKILDELGAWYYMPAQSGYGQKGIPDFIICAGGLFVAIETKAAGGRPTKLQSLTLDAITKANGIALVIDESNVGQVKEWLTDVKWGWREYVVHLSWRDSIPTSKNDG